MSSTTQYKDLTAYRETIGAVTVAGIPLQLCDYVESIGGNWYAVAYFSEAGPYDGKILEQAGVVVKALPSSTGDEGMQLAYVPMPELDKAIPRYQDENNTQMLIDRLKKELGKLNASGMKVV